MNSSHKLTLVSQKERPRGATAANRTRTMPKNQNPAARAGMSVTPLPTSPVTSFPRSSPPLVQRDQKLRKGLREGSGPKA
jgi:hypothetical protein